MTIGASIRITYGRLRGQRGIVTASNGRHVTVKGSFGVVTLLASEVSE